MYPYIVFMKNVYRALKEFKRCIHIGT